jgi:flagellar biosynthesis anti-sigma factor FlgM
VVDPIGAKPLRSPGSPVSPVGAAAAAPQVAAVRDEAEAAPSGSIATAARHAAAAAPIDHERVATLRAAIANGDYRPVPQAIADKMIGAMQEWIAK